MDALTDAQISAIAKRYTLTRHQRRDALIKALRAIDARGIEGDIVECGVWRGGNIIIARKVCPERTCWLYDTFAGMTEPGPEDVSRNGSSALQRYNSHKESGEGWCAASLEDVHSALTMTGCFDPGKLRFVVGRVEETLKRAQNIPERIALLRLDTDWYESTKIELETLYPKLAPGGVLIVDDYGHWRGSKQAVDEVLGAAAFEFIDYSAVMMVRP